MDQQLIHEATGALIAALSSANNYFAGQEPWALKKTDPARMATVLYVTADTVRRLAIRCSPSSRHPRAGSRHSSLFPLRAVPWWMPQTLTVLLTGTELPVPQASSRGSKSRPNRHADRQPLPPRFRRPRRRYRRVMERAAAAGVTGNGHDFHTCGEIFSTYTAIAEQHTERSGARWARIRTMRTRNCMFKRMILVRLSAHPVALPSARLASTILRQCPRAAQATGLRRHIAAARITGLPLVIHRRRR